LLHSVIAGLDPAIPFRKASAPKIGITGTTLAIAYSDSSPGDAKRRAGFLARMTDRVAHTSNCG
jgi:hypothetical protein